METLIVRDGNLNELFIRLQNHLRGTLTTRQGELRLSTNTSTSQGCIHGQCYSNAIAFIKCSLHLKTELKFRIKPKSSPSYLYFVFCNKGMLMHRNDTKGEFNPIHQYQTAVINPGKQGTEFRLPKNSNPELIVIKIHPKIYLKKERFNPEIDHSLQNLYRAYNEKYGYSHYGSYNLKICEYYKRIDTIAEKGFIKKIMLEGRIKLLLAILIKQYKDDVLNQHMVEDLTTTELQRIKAVAQDIEKNPSAPYSIKKLTYSYAISPSKLQKGFKILFNRTVADYIKNLRIEVAEEMIKNRDCTISEIVYDIGFTSRSYFSKIFKEKYHCSPKNYQEKLKLNNLTI